MKSIIILGLCVVAVCSSPAIDFRRSSNTFQIRPKVGDLNGSFSDEYTYIDHEGYTHNVKYTAGPKVGFKILEDKIQYPHLRQIHVPGYILSGSGYRRVNSKDPNSQPSIEFFKNIPGIEVEEIVNVHHLRNEVPATVHKTIVPKRVHAVAPPPVLSRRFIVKHDVPVYNSL